MRNRKNPYKPKTLALCLMGGGAAVALTAWYLSRKEQEVETPVAVIPKKVVRDAEYDPSSDPDANVKTSDDIAFTPPTPMPTLKHRDMLEPHLTELEITNEQVPLFGKFPVDDKGVIDKTKYQPFQASHDADYTTKARAFHAKMVGLPMAEFMKRRETRKKKNEKKIDLPRKGDYEVASGFDPEVTAGSSKKRNPVVGSRANLNEGDIRDPAIRPDFSGALNFVDYKNLLAGTPEMRRANMSKIAEVSGITFSDEDITDSIEMQKKAVPVFTSDTANPDRTYVDGYLKNCKDEGIVYALAALLACEGSDMVLVYDKYLRQLEYVAMLWAIINRFNTGATAKKLKSSFSKNYALVDGIAAATLTYDPIAKVEGNRGSKKDLAISLVPLVRAFLAGYFNDITGGATHWYHPPKKGEFPPKYYYPAGTKGRDGKDIPAHSLRQKDVPVSFVNDCMLVKVDEGF